MLGNRGRSCRKRITLIICYSGISETALVREGRRFQFDGYWVTWGESRRFDEVCQRQAVLSAHSAKCGWLTCNVKYSFSWWFIDKKNSTITWKRLHSQGFETREFLHRNGESKVNECIPDWFWAGQEISGSEIQTAYSLIKSQRAYRYSSLCIY